MYSPNKFNIVLLIYKMAHKKSRQKTFRVVKKRVSDAAVLQLGDLMTASGFAFPVYSAPRMEVQPLPRLTDPERLC